MTGSSARRHLPYITNASFTNRVIYIRLLFSIIMFPLLSGCSPPPVPLDLIEDLIIADLIHDNEYLIYHTLGASRGSPSLLKIPSQEIEALRQMLKPNYISQISYKGYKATVFVDISSTGIIEWFNVNKLKVHPNTHFEEMRYKVLYMQYSNSRWYKCFIRTLSRPSLEGWPKVPEEFLERISE